MKPEHMNHGSHNARMKAAFHEQPFISHEWEELVEKLTASEDPKLRRIGQLEQEFLKLRKSPSRVS